MLIKKNLTLVGHSCVCVFDGEAVFDALEENAFDLILLDIMMPKMDGFQVLEELRKNIPVIFLTARFSVDDKVKGLRLGADDYIVKPFDMLELQARIETVLRRFNKADTAFVLGYVPQLSAPTVTVLSAEQRQATTDSTIFVPPNITVITSPFQQYQIPTSAMPMEEAAHVGAQYIWDSFGVNLDEMYFVMSYVDCWLRPGRGRWFGTVALPAHEAPFYGYFVTQDGVIDWQWGDIVFSFTIDSISGERLEIRYDTPRGNHPPRVIAHDTQPLWESAQGRAVQAMNGQELAEFVGLAPNRLADLEQEALAMAQAHFINSDDVNIRLGTIRHTPTGSIDFGGIDVLLDTDANGNIFGTFEGIRFTATDEFGNEAIISITEWLGFRGIAAWSVL